MVPPWTWILLFLLTPSLPDLYPLALIVIETLVFYYASLYCTTKNGPNYKSGYFPLSLRAFVIAKYLLVSL